MPSRPKFYDNMIGGLVMNLAGPELLKLGFHVFVVIVGVLILSGAVNTSLIGVNGVLNRVAEDGVLIDWFRKPHREVRNDIPHPDTDGATPDRDHPRSAAATCFCSERRTPSASSGVSRSKSLGVLVLRYQRHDQEYKFPLNVRIGHTEIPIGLGITTSALFLIGVANLFFEADHHHIRRFLHHVLYTLFMISERINARKQDKQRSDLEKFNLDHQPQVPPRLYARGPGAFWWQPAIINHMFIWSEF